MLAGIRPLLSMNILTGKTNEVAYENKQSAIRLAKILISSAFDLPENECVPSLKVSRHLEVNF